CQLLEFLILFVNCAFALLFIEFFPRLVSVFPERVDLLSEKGGALFDLVFVCTIVFLAASWGEWRLRKLTEFPPYQIARDSKVLAPPVPVAVLQGAIPVRSAQMEQLSKGERLEKYTDLAQNLGVALFIVPEAALRLEESEGKTLFSRLAGV